MVRKVINIITFGCNLTDFSKHKKNVAFFKKKSQNATQCMRTYIILPVKHREPCMCGVVLTINIETHLLNGRDSDGTALRHDMRVSYAGLAPVLMHC
jgi:hypothetical protein